MLLAEGVEILRQRAAAPPAAAPAAPAAQHEDPGHARGAGAGAAGHLATPPDAPQVLCARRPPKFALNLSSAAMLENPAVLRGVARLLRMQRLHEGDHVIALGNMGLDEDFIAVPLRDLAESREELARTSRNEPRGYRHLNSRR